MGTRDTGESGGAGDRGRAEVGARRPLLGPAAVVSFAVFVLAVVGLGVVLDRAVRRRVRHDAALTLSAVADLKVAQLATWRADRQHDADVVVDNPMAAEAMGRYLEGPDASREEAQLRAWFGALLASWNYRSVFLVDRSRRVRLLVGEPSEVIDASTDVALDRAEHSGEPAVSDVFRDGRTHHACIDIAAEIPAPADEESPGFVVLRVALASFLFPFIQRWPTPSDTAETLVVTRDGDDAVFINQVRHRPDSALKMRLPLSTPGLPAADAIKGFEGITEAPDYRQVAVLAATRRVPGSPWFLVSKVDDEEVYRDARRIRFLEVGMAAALGLPGALAITFVSYRQRAQDDARMRGELEIQVQARTAELRDALAAADAAHALTRMLVHASPVGILAYAGTGECTTANTAAAEILGGTVEQLEAQNFRTIASWETSGLRDMAEAVLRSGEGRRLDFRIHTTFGRELWLECHLTPISTAGEPGLLLMLEDRSELKRAESQLRVHRDRLEELVQARTAELEKVMVELKRSNVELEQFASVASHDLQEPLRMIRSYVQLLGRRYRGKLDDDADEFIHYASDGAERLQGMIDDLLALSRVGTRGRAPVSTDSAECVRQALKHLEVAVRDAGAEVAYEGLPKVLADPAQLVQLFQNLIGNAIKFHGDRPPVVRIGAERRGEHWELFVKDNGIGFDPAYRDRVFEIFQRLHGQSQYHGSGIGLAICKKIVERHGGRIWAESEEGKGATFRFTFPPAPPAEEPA